MLSRVGQLAFWRRNRGWKHTFTFLPSSLTDHSTVVRTPFSSTDSSILCSCSSTSSAQEVFCCLREWSAVERGLRGRCTMMPWMSAINLKVLLSRCDLCYSNSLIHHKNSENPSPFCSSSQSRPTALISQPAARITK